MPSPPPRRGSIPRLETAQLSPTHHTGQQCAPNRFPRPSWPARDKRQSPPESYTAPASRQASPLAPAPPALDESISGPTVRDPDLKAESARPTHSLSPWPATPESPSAPLTRAL